MIYILLVIGFTLLGYFIYTYNQFIKYQNLIETSWADIDVYLTKRHELIPNLVNIVKGYLKHEKETLEAVVHARSEAIKSAEPNSQIPFENEISSFLSKVFVLAEDYPDLKANESFNKLHIELTNVENEIANARRYYNAVVRDNNNLRESFPSMIVGSLFNFKTEKFFEAPINAQKTVEIKLDD